jgi:hypothetical protein
MKQSLESFQENRISTPLRTAAMPLSWLKPYIFMLTERDLEILHVLTKKVPILSVSQVARTWWGEALHPVEAARNRLRALEAQAFVHTISFPVHPEVPLAHPLFAWFPGQPEPDFGALAYRAQARWARPPVFQTFAYATRKAAAHLGGFGGSRPDANHATHDMHLANVFLLKRLHEPASAQSWESEDTVRAERSDYDDKLPDAIVTDPAKIAIDFVGKYPKTKLEAFHRYCERERMGYELW